MRFKLVFKWASVCLIQSKEEVTALSRFDRYLLSQLLMLFGFFALILVLVYWVNRAVVLFDTLIADGQSAWVFLEFTVLTLPGVIALVLPLACFIASIYVINRLTTDSEMVVIQATGFSPFRLARPVFVYGVIATVLTLSLTHFLVPMSSAQYNTRSAEVSQNLTARLLVEGRFMSPANGITVYIREITHEGELLDVFLSDTRSDTETVTYTATRAYLLRTETGPQLLMRDGMAQTLNTRTQNLLITNFDDFAYDVSDLITGVVPSGLRISEMTTPALIAALNDPTLSAGLNHGVTWRLIHTRNTDALLALIGALLGFAPLLTGGFSRFGVWRQIMIAVGLVVLIKALETTAANAVRQNADLAVLLYVPTLIGMGLTWLLLYIAGRPYLFKKTPKAEPLS